MAISTQKYSANQLKATDIGREGIIIDKCVCTLVQAIIDLLRQHGVQITEQQVRATTGISHFAQLEAITAMDQVMLQWEQANGFYPTQRDVCNLHRELVQFLDNPRSHQPNI